MYLESLPTDIPPILKTEALRKLIEAEQSEAIEVTVDDESDYQRIYFFVYNNYRGKFRTKRKTNKLYFVRK